MQRSQMKMNDSANVFNTDHDTRTGNNGPPSPPGPAESTTVTVPDGSTPATGTQASKTRSSAPRPVTGVGSRIVAEIGKIDHQRKIIAWTGVALFVGATLILVLFKLLYFDSAIAGNSLVTIKDTIINKQVNTYIYLAIGCIATLAAMGTTAYYLVNVKNGKLVKTEKLPFGILVLGLSTYTLYLFFRALHRLCFALGIISKDIWSTKVFYSFTIMPMSRLLRPLAMHTVTVLSMRIVIMYIGYPSFIPRPRWVPCKQSVMKILMKRRALLLAIFALCIPAMAVTIWQFVMIWQFSVDYYIATPITGTPNLAIEVYSAVFDLWMSISLLVVRGRMKKLDLDQSFYLVPLSFLWFIYVFILYGTQWTLLRFYGAIVKWVQFVLEITLAALFFAITWSTIRSMKRPQMGATSSRKTASGEAGSMSSISASRHFSEKASKTKSNAGRGVPFTGPGTVEVDVSGAVVEK